MKLKRNIFVGIACVLVLTLGITMVCVGCRRDDQPDWNYTGTVNQTQSPNPTDSQGTDGTGGSSATGDATTPGGSTETTGPIYTPAGPDDPAPSVNVEVVDREELPTTPDSSTETKPPVTPTKPSVPDTDGPQLDENGYWTYEYYLSRTGDEQEAYMKTFPSLKDFNKWFNAAQKAYNDAQPKETIGPDGIITLD